MAYLREMVSEDLLAVVRLEEQSFSVPWTAGLLADALQSPLDRLWVITEQEKVLGYYNFRMIAGEGELMRIAVDPSVRGRGFGRKLLEHLEKEASEHQIKAVTLEVRASNQAAICLYKSCGFQTEAVRKGYYTHPVEDALIMWKHRA